MQTTVYLTEKAYLGLRPLSSTMQRVARSTSITPKPSAAAQCGAVYINGRFMLPAARKHPYNVYHSKTIIATLQQMAMEHGYIRAQQGNLSAFMEAIGLGLYEVYP